MKHPLSVLPLCCVLIGGLPACTGSIDGAGAMDSGGSDGGDASSGGNSAENGGATASGGVSGNSAGGNTAEGGETSTAGSAGTTASLAGLSGEEVFAGLCATCHGAQGEGSELGPELQHPVVAFSSFVARNGQTGGEYPGVMIAYPDTLVSDDQLDEIWAFLGSFPQPETGEGLWLDYCGNCHGKDGLGGRVNKDIREKANELGDMREKVREGEGGNNYGAAAQYMPHWGSGEISDAEIDSIASHLGTL